MLPLLLIRLLTDTEIAFAAINNEYAESVNNRLFMSRKFDDSTKIVQVLASPWVLEDLMSGEQASV